MQFCIIGHQLSHQILCEWFMVRSCIKGSCPFIQVVLLLMNIFFGPSLYKFGLFTNHTSLYLLTNAYLHLLDRIHWEKAWDRCSWTKVPGTKVHEPFIHDRTICKKTNQANLSFYHLICLDVNSTNLTLEMILKTSLILFWFQQSWRK